MGTKIYNGYRLPKYNLTQLVQFNESICESIFNIAQHQYHQIFTNSLIDLIDDISVGNLIDYNDLHDEYKTKNLIYLTEYFLKDRMRNIRATNHRDPDVDFETTVTYFPIKGKLLAIFNCEQDVINKFWSNLHNVIDYHYQDQSDKPKNLTQKQWLTRRDDWDLALDNKNSWVVNKGITYSFIREQYLYAPSVVDIIKLVKPLGKRLERLAKKEFIKNYVNDMCTNLPEKEKSTKLINFSLEALDLLEKNDTFIKNIYDGLIEKYRNLLINEFTENTLPLNI